jgi:hypothetical protein
LRADIIAGIALAAYLLPSGLGDASLANLPPQAGLYAVLFSGLLFWLFCSSRHTAITVTSAISLLVGSSLGAIAGGDTTRLSALAAATALLVGAIAFVAWLVSRPIVNFISKPCWLDSKQVWLYTWPVPVTEAVGFKGGEGSLWRQLHFIQHLGNTNTAALSIGIGVSGAGF